MSNGSSLLPHWQKEAERFHQKVALLERRLSHPAIHDARVAMKKLRSYARLADKVMHTSLRVSVAPFATLYRTAGACRDAYNATQLLQTFSRQLEYRFPLFEAYLKIALQASARYLRKMFALLPISENEWLLLAEPQGLGKMLSAQTVQAMQDEVQALWENVKMPASSRDAEALHELRKELKRLFYWLEVVPVSQTFAFRHHRELEDLNSLLGKWHDLYQLERRVRTFREELLGKGTNERRQLKLLLKEIEQRKRKRYEAMCEKLSFLLKAYPK
ncbi:MAG: CHAD domain-containing protein [Chloroherpetonaceae bacterium]|nr:CHAD domain-containing protein [Chloroherpetonaceae bacterium]MCS7210541.1 CHAD domain-containing protein [Chloroherpetonaceae bacterium]MDW8020976.1 CHAD domain-containing protein [Chloroherpetonaceae bacterium]MDW8467185.1 CHAD domain-containing protein [Chloroherpetonaceae bacterium]